MSDSSSSSTSARKRLLIFGDSNTYGYDPFTGRGSGMRYPADSRWPDLFAREQEDRWEIFVDGLPGRCIPEMRFEWESWNDLVRRFAPLDRTLVMLGTNDYLSRKPDPDFVAARMERFLRQAREDSRLEGAEWVVLAPPCLDFGEDRWYKPFTTTNGCLSRALEVCAKNLGVLFLDAGAWPLPLAPDGIHLSPEGHRALARHLLEVWDTL